MRITDKQRTALLAEAVVIRMDHQEHRHRLYRWVAECILGREMVAKLLTRRDALIFEEWSATWQTVEKES